MVLIADTSQISGPLAKEALRRKLTQERKDAAKLKRTQLRTHVDPETPAPLNPTAALAQSLQSDIKLALEQSEATWSLLLQETQQLWDARVALQQAVGRGDVAAVEAQIKAGGELEFCDQDGNTMLMCAACLGHDDLVQSLLDMKAVGLGCGRVRVFAGSQPKEQRRADRSPQSIRGGAGHHSAYTT
eukprot:TRINITY_DN619_c0_g1_i12.p1 TRINITY_DN619_c0_g1~~TRINITY_DN619_c0_g1_i12.p1  ORF type:complete len:187 (+),score=40.31 TRINITY_DN619_c0_g1_i12:142-702(+)